MQNKYNADVSVDVIMITYLHEKYVSEAIEGILMQKTEFPYRLIIGEDFGQDGTRRICEEYAAKYPDKILLFPSEKNWGMIANFIRVYQVCFAPYIAICEGDDYWTDPHKLQKQVDFLEKKPKYVLCGHDYDCVDFNGEKIGYLKWTNKREYTQKDLALFNPFSTATVLFRNKLSVFPDWYRKCFLSDWALFLMITQYGKAYILPEKMSIYRKHSGGVWSLISPHQKTRLGEAQLEILNSEFPQFKNQFRFVALNNRINQLYWNAKKPMDLIRCFFLILITKQSPIKWRDVLYRFKNKLYHS